MPYRAPPAPPKSPGPPPGALGPTKPPKRKRPKAPPPSGEDIRLRFQQPNAPVPNGPPVKVLQKFGTHLSIADVNDRVQQITDAHQAVFGHLPSPGLVFDLLRSPVSDFHSLFRATPRSQAVARAHGALGADAGNRLAPTGPPRPFPQLLIEDAQQALHQGGLAEFEKQNRQELNALIRDPKWGPRLYEAIGSAPATEASGVFPESALVDASTRQLQRETNADMKAITKARALGDLGMERRARERLRARTPQLEAAGLADTGVHGILGHGVAQIATSLAYAPAGLYLAGKAGYLDTRAAFHGDTGFERTRKIAIASAKGIAADVRHPAENPGYLFMDVLGLVSFGAGTAVRVTRAASLARVGEVRAATRALVTRPIGGTYVLRKGASEEHVLLFENPAAQLVQRATLRLRQRALTERHGLPEARQPVTAGRRRLDLSSEARMGREAAARQRVETAIAKTYQTELEKAAGWSIVSAETYRRLPVEVRRDTQKLPGHAPFGLTRGEQKAIQVLSTDDPNPLRLHRDFHERMKATPTLGEQFGLAPDQFIANHDRHLADLKLAGKVLADLEAGKARPRFLNAVGQTRRVVAEQQRLKIEELGLLPDVAERRIIGPADVLRKGESLPDVTGLNSELERLQAVEKPDAKQARRIQTLTTKLEQADRRIEDFNRTSEASFYLPFVPKRYKKAVPRSILRPAKAGPYGIPYSRDLSELKHVFTGKSIIAGDFRTDATALAGEAYGRTVRLVSVRNDHARLLKAAKDTQAEAGPFAVPIRDVANLPPRLRERLARIDEGELTTKDADALSKNQIDSILHELYPNPAEQIEGVKWVDGRLVGDEGVRIQEGRVVSRSAQPTVASAFFDVANEPFRFSYLFLRPAYALNLVGNAAMGLIHQGVHLPPNLARAVFAEKTYGGNVARAMDALVGEGKMQAIGETAGTAKATALTRSIAHAWSVLTDRHFRRAALIHELRRQGFRTPEEMHAALFDKANLPKLVEAKRRANKAMVEFDNLTWYEKNVLRHVIFVYPWVSRSAVWSIRTLIEHPIQSAILVELGRQAKDEEDPLFAHTPDWIKRTGYIPVGLNPDGSPKLLNPTSVNTFSTINDLMNLASGGEIPEDFSSPVIEIGIRAFTQADQYGQRFKGKQRVLGPFGASVEQIPLVRAIKGPKAQPAEEPLNPADREAYVKQEHAALKQTVLTPGWMGNWGKLVAGGLSPSELNLPAAAARYWRDQSPEARNKHERALIQRGLELQGGLLNEKPPLKVRQAVEIMGEQTLRRSQRSKELGRDVPAVSKEGALVDLQVLQEKGKVSTPEAEQLRASLAKVPDAAGLQRFVRKLHKLGGSEDLSQWQADVNLVASFTPGSTAAHFQQLKSQELIRSKPKADDQHALNELGRRVLAFQRELARRSKAHKNDPRAQKQIFNAELRAFQAEQDKPVRVGGQSFPSVVRMAWALLSPKQQADHRASIADADWKSLSTFDKELLGRSSSPAVAHGWANLQRILAAFKGDVPMEGVTALPPGTKIAANQLLALVRYVDRGEKGYLKPSPGFYKDWLFAREPKYRRLPLLKPVQTSQFRSQWHYVLSNANVLGREIDKGRYPNSALKEAWHEWINGNEFQTWLSRQPAPFRHELDSYGPDFLPSLLN